MIYSTGQGFKIASGSSMDKYISTPRQDKWKDPFCRFARGGGLTGITARMTVTALASSLLLNLQKKARQAGHTNIISRNTQSLAKEMYRGFGRKKR